MTGRISNGLGEAEGGGIMGDQRPAYIDMVRTCASGFVAHLKVGDELVAHVYGETQRSCEQRAEQLARSLGDQRPETAQHIAEQQCPACGYYCTGKGGRSCIDKPSLLTSRPAPDPALAPDLDDLVKRMIEECAPFLKPGESPAQCIERNRADADQCLELSVRYQRALEAIVALDFAKDAHGRDDFYSGAPRFVQAWHLANEALRRGSGPTAAERSMRVPVDPPEADPALARVRALIETWKLASAHGYSASKRTDLGEIVADRFQARHLEREQCLADLAAALEGENNGR